MAKPLMLVMLPDSKVFREGLEKAGIAGDYEIADVAPGTKPDADKLARAEVVLAFAAPPGVFAEMPKLKWVQSMTAGVDQWLARKDLSHDHTLTTARGTHLPQMPENILGALFHITKKYHQIELAQQASKWVRSMSVPLAGKTLGVLGLGAIGQDLACKATALGMSVIGTKNTPEPLAGVLQVYASHEADEVLAHSDFVVLLLPVTPKTENLINAQRLARMKKDAWLLNFGRGALIVDDDLIAAIKAKTIAGAVLDVFRTEPLPAEHPFWTTAGICVLPHIGGGHPTRDRMVAELFTENAKRYLIGSPLKEAVDRSRGY